MYHRTMTTGELSKEKTADLLDFISSGKEELAYKELGDNAFAVFVERFREDLVNKCVVLCRKWKRPDDFAVDLAAQVFDRYYKYPKYKHESCIKGITDDCIKRYLYGIANKEVIKLFCPTYSPYDGTEEIVITLADPEKGYPPETFSKLKDYEGKLDAIFEKLSPKHKIIYLTYKQYEELGYTLPRKLLEELRTKLELNQNTIRVYKKQAIELVASELQNAR